MAMWQREVLRYIDQTMNLKNAPHHHEQAMECMLWVCRRNNYQQRLSSQRTLYTSPTRVSYKNIRSTKRLNFILRDHLPWRSRLTRRKYEPVCSAPSPTLTKLVDRFVVSSRGSSRHNSTALLINEEITMQWLTTMTRIYRDTDEI